MSPALLLLLLLYTDYHIVMYYGEKMVSCAMHGTRLKVNSPRIMKVNARCTFDLCLRVPIKMIRSGCRCR